MPITYPLTLPSGFPFERFELREMNTAGISASVFTLEEQAFEWPGERWEVECTLVRMTRDDGAIWSATLSALYGRSGTFFLTPPFARTPRGAALPTHTPVVDGAGQVGKTLAIRGFPANTVNILRAGDFIHIGVGTRLYKVLTDASTDATGKVTVDIWPRLRPSPADGEVIATSDPRGIFRLREPHAETWLPGNFVEISFRAIEALR